MQEKMENQLFGVIDSGVGGLSLLSDIRVHSPNHDIIYFADSCNIPYGDKSVGWMHDRALGLCQKLIEMGAQVLIIACNTITCNCIASIRANVTIPVIGIEPALKPAALMNLGKKIAVLGTENTLKSSRLKQLAVENSETEFMFYPCRGLADAIEKGDLDSKEIIQLATRYLLPALDNNVSIVVLGCTHYSLIKPLIQKIIGPDVLIIEPSIAVARQVIRLTNTAIVKKNKPAVLSVYRGCRKSPRLIKIG